MDFLHINKLFATDYFAIPDYQRDYEWSGAQNVTLIDDIFSLLDKDVNHFIGAIVTVPFEESNATSKTIKLEEYQIDQNNVHHVVDGQQRLTSLSVLICALKKCIEEDLNLLPQKKKNYSIQLEQMLFGNDFNENSQRAPHLILNGNTGRCYNNEILKNSEATFNKCYKGAKRLLAAYDLFQKSIVEEKNKYVEENTSTAEVFYKALIDVLVKKIIFVEIRCDGSSNAFQVFDSLNGKGLDLTAADRIKNIMLSWSTDSSKAQKWDSFVAEVGDDYLVNFFVALFFYEKAKRISKNKLPDEFKNQYYNDAKGGFDAFYEKLKNFGQCYGAIRKHNTGSVEFDEALMDFECLGSDQVYVIIFAACVGYHIDISHPSKDFKEFLKKLTRAIVRMQICDKSMNRLDFLFSNCINWMKNDKKDLSYINEQIDLFVNKYITDEQFKNCFVNFSTSNNKLSEFYLRHIENKMREEVGERTPVSRGLTVEHIIPQTLSNLADWYGSVSIPDSILDDSKDLLIERLGNMALLYGDDNASASNNNYAAKINVYKNGKLGQNQGNPVGTFKMIENLIKKFPATFNDSEVNQRSEDFANYALRIW